MGFIIGMDIGGTKCAVLLAECIGNNVSFHGRIEFTTDLTVSPENIIQTLCKSGEQLIRENIRSNVELQGIGIACGGPLDSKNGVILSPPNLPGWNHVDVAEMVQTYFHVPVRLVNDANAGAIAEWKFGAGRGADNIVFLTLGTGCGAGLILNGKLYEGSTDNAGECGHIRLEKYGPPGYGKCGSMEGFCSGGGIAELGRLIGRAYMQAGMKTALEPYIKSGNLTAKDIADQARNGDPASCEVFQMAGRQLGRGISIIIDLLDPERIILGGMYMRCKDLLDKEMNKTVREESLRVPTENCEIVPAALGEQIGDYAAIAAAL